MKQNVAFLLRLTIDGRPRYLPVPITTLTPRMLVMISFIGDGTTVLKKTSNFGRLMACPDANSHA